MIPVTSFSSKGSSLVSKWPLLAFQTCVSMNKATETKQNNQKIYKALVPLAVKSAQTHLVLTCGRCKPKKSSVFGNSSSQHPRTLRFLKSAFTYSLLYGLPQHLLSRLRSVQNTATRTVTRTSKFDHITLILKKFHWRLPVCYRIPYISHLSGKGKVKVR